jgi:hypothetical protein
VFVRVLLGVRQVVEIHKVRLPDGVAARTDGVDIWVDDRLNDIQLKCAIEHEKIHIEMGHSTVQVEAVEMAVRYQTALRLLPPGTPARCKGAGSLAAAARALGVTRQVLMDRAAVATHEEVVEAGCAECLLCPVIQARFVDHPSAYSYRYFREQLA